MRHEVDAAQALLPGLALRRPHRLDSSDRATVHRVGTRDGESLIVKQYLHAGEGWARETAALAVLPEHLRVPRVVAAGLDPPVVVMTDAGRGGNVAEALMGDDPAVADRRLLAWARALAAVHAATAGLRGRFRVALDARAVDAAAHPGPMHDTRLGADIDDAVRVLDRLCGSLGVVVPDGALDEVRALDHRLGPDGTAALTPADACPDDNVVADDGELTIVDWENAQWRHVAWDVAYLQVPFPTCWCSWRLPDDVGAAAVEEYRRAAGAALPGVADERFLHDVAAATTGWALMSAALFLDVALGRVPPLSGRYRRAPTRRAVIDHRLHRAAASHELPAAAELAGRLLAELRGRWGDEQLLLAPAYRARDRG